MTLNQLHGAIWVVAALTLVAFVFRIPLRAWWQRAVSALGIAFFLVSSLITAAGPFVALDFRSFWRLGAVILSGGDAIEWIGSHKLPPLNPPTAYPLFAAFALLPIHASLVAWVGASAGICLALIPLSYRTLVDRGVPGAAELPARTLAVATATFVLSNAPRSMLQSGQLAAIGALGLLAALVAQGRGQPARAGAWLALGTIKPNTTVPFLVLFLRRTDWKAWAVLAGLCVVACLGFGWGVDVRRSASAYLRAINEHGLPGAVNDATFAGPQTAGMVGLDYALYRLGFRAPGSNSLAQTLALLALGAPLAYQILRGDGLPTGGDCAQVGLYSCVFLYHRTHDFVVLALPFTYAMIRCQTASGKARWAFTTAVVAILLALTQQRRLIELLEASVKTRTDPISLLLQAVILPYATWSVLTAMLALALGERWTALRPTRE
jgi:hypothetical protein